MTLSYSYLFQLALELALLTFYIGALIYALPLPTRGVKRWGGTLVRDSITSYALALSLLSILSFSNHIAMLLGGSWAYLDLWLKTGLVMVLGAKMVIAALGPLLSSVPVGSSVKALLGPLNDALTADLLFLITVMAVEVMVRYAGLLIAFIGLVLYALPFRIGREAGAWFIAFVIVFSVGLQVMPAFISSVAQAPPLNLSSEFLDLGVIFRQVSVRSAYGTPIGTALLSLYIDYKGKWTNVGIYPVNVSGMAYSLNSPYGNMISMPSMVPVYAMVEVDGISSALEPYPMTNATEYITLTSPYILYSDGYGLLVFTNQPSNATISVNGNKVTVHDELGYGGILEVRAPRTCDVSVSSNIRPATGSWSWYGVRGTYYALYGPLNATMVLEIGNCSEAHLVNAPSMDYLTQFLSNTLSISPNIIEDFIVYYFTVPLMYFAVLTSVAYAVARLLGGRRGIMPRVV